MSSFEERKQARIERYRELAEKAAQKSELLARETRKILDTIPPGQPMMVDHYSYNSDMRCRDRIWRKRDKSVEEAKKSGYYFAKAESAESNTAIFSDDPQALEKLKAKLEDLVDSHAFMKQINAYYRLHKTCHGAEGLSDELAEEIESAMQYHPWDPTPFPAYALSNSNQEIRRIRERIQQIEHDSEVGYVGWEFKGGRAVANQEETRLQLFFDEKPPEDQRKELRANGFVFSRENMAWQRKLNRSAIRAADYLPFIQPLSGERPSALQPKPPQRETEELTEEPPPLQTAEQTEGKRHDSGRFPSVTVQDLLAVLGESYPAVFTNEGMPAYLDAIARFYNYSYNNILLIHIMRPDAEHVEGFGTWKVLGRNVKRGEHGIKILAPCPIREQDEDQPANKDQEQKNIKTLFKVTTVFDIKQTEGKELPERYAGLTEADTPAFQKALSELLPASHGGSLEDMPSIIQAIVCERLGGETTVDAAPNFETSAAAYVVCRRFGLPTPALNLEAMKGKTNDIEQMKTALSCVRDTAVSVMEDLELKVYGRVQARPKEGPTNLNRKKRKRVYRHER